MRRHTVVRSCRRLSVGVGWAMLWLGFVTACTPALNWREVRPTADLVLLFPCKPAVETRNVPLADRKVAMEMRVCETQGVTYALAHADLQDPGRTAQALQELRVALSSKVRGTPSGLAWAPAGATPNSAAGRWHLTGPRPDGVVLEQDAAFFSYGTQVFQLVVMGPRLSPEALETFFESVKLPT